MGALALSLVLSGCKKEAEVQAQVTVQAEKSEHGVISEKIMADAVLAPNAQAAIEPKITAPRVPPAVTAPAGCSGKGANPARAATSPSSTVR